jgi:hypothetical protein
MGLARLSPWMSIMGLQGCCVIGDVLFSFVFSFLLAGFMGVGDWGASSGSLGHEDRNRAFLCVLHRPFRPRSVYD